MVKKQGPGIWLHWHCLDEVTNLVELPRCMVDGVSTFYCTRDHPNGHWQTKWWIKGIPLDWRSRYSGTCPWCEKAINVGDHTMKVAVGAKTLWAVKV